MRGIHSALLGGFAAVLLSTAATAQPSAPFCLHVYGPITYDDCSYISMDQCRPSAVGRSAACITNPFYVAPKPARRGTQRQDR